MKSYEFIQVKSNGPILAIILRYDRKIPGIAAVNGIAIGGGMERLSI